MQLQIQEIKGMNKRAYKLVTRYNAAAQNKIIDCIKMGLLASERNFN